MCNGCLFIYHASITLGMQNGIRTNITPINYKKVWKLTELPDGVSFNDCLTVLLTKFENEVLEK